MKIEAITAKKFRQHFQRWADEVNRHNGAVIITRKHHPNVVLVSAAAFAAWQADQQHEVPPVDHDDLQHSMDELTNAAGDDPTPHDPDKMPDESTTDDPNDND